jgi:predicted neutral ceramidase superfamily lipid hydrolase
MKVNVFISIIVLSIVLLLIAVAPFYTPMKPIEWILAVSFYFIVSFLWLLIKTWSCRSMGVYITIYIWVGAMIYATIQGIAENRIVSGWVAGCLGGAILGGIIGYATNSIRNITKR